VHTLPSLEITVVFLESFTRLSPADQRRIVRTLAQLETDEQTPGLGVHPLHGDQEDVWAARASSSLRVRLRRLDRGRKLLIDCSHHYGDKLMGGRLLTRDPVAHPPDDHGQ
jgi:hypothetical protein